MASSTNRCDHLLALDVGCMWEHTSMFKLFGFHLFISIYLLYAFFVYDLLSVVVKYWSPPVFMCLSKNSNAYLLHRNIISWIISSIAAWTKMVKKFYCPLWDLHRVPLMMSNNMQLNIPMKHNSLSFFLFGEEDFPRGRE
jgi:hypothetical protein